MKYKISVSILLVVVSAMNLYCRDHATTVQAQKDNPRVRISVVLPKASHATPAPNILSDGSAVLSILPDSLEADTFYLGNDPVVQSNVSRRLSSLLGSRSSDQQIVYVQAFRTVEYGALLSVLKPVREGGVERIGLIVELERNEGLAVFEIKIAKKVIPPGRATQKSNAGLCKTTSNPANQSPPSPRTQAGTQGALLVDVMPGGNGPDQRVKLNDRTAELVEAASALKDMLKQQPNKTAVIKAPADKLYGDVVWVVDLLKGAGAQAIEIQIDHFDPRQQARKSAGGASSPPLIAAVKRDDLAAVESLLAKGADVNARDHAGKTALVVAAEWGHTEITRALLAKGADQVNEALQVAQRAEIAEMFLAKGANVNKKDEGGLTLLMNAAMGGDAEKVRILLAHGADVNMKESHGSTALLLAAYGGSLEVFQALLAKGADRNARDNEGRNAFIYAARQGHHDILQALLAKGADVNVKDNEDKTALMFAAQFDRMETVQFLLANGADVNAKDRQGRTALIYAIGLQEVKLQPEMIQALLAKGAEVNSRDQAGKTALGYALKYQDSEIDKEVAGLLRKAGGKE